MKMSIGPEDSRTQKDRDTMSGLRVRNISASDHCARRCCHIVHFAPVSFSPFITVIHSIKCSPKWVAIQYENLFF